MSATTEKRRSQREIFADACKQLQCCDLSVTSILIMDLFECMVHSQLVLDDYMLRQNGRNAFTSRTVCQWQLRGDTSVSRAFGVLPKGLLHPR